MTSPEIELMSCWEFQSLMNLVMMERNDRTPTTYSTRNISVDLNENPVKNHGKKYRALKVNFRVEVRKNEKSVLGLLFELKRRKSLASSRPLTPNLTWQRYKVKLTFTNFSTVTKTLYKAIFSCLKIQWTNVDFSFILISHASSNETLTRQF